ncbi:MAG: pyridoxal 5'-phosphate synthase glutaminase subunit PdxT [bacterium]|nr:pyridoxal 5'-phosphate synthase glutaminase subunit PdxT [bacterium]
MVGGRSANGGWPVVGVLALQGDYARHRAALVAAGADSRDVRTAEDLKDVSALIIPGGESTTMTLLLDAGLREPLGEFCRAHPVWGTCAGMILLAKSSGDSRIRPLELMDVAVNRNGFGRQVHSFEAELRVSEELGERERSLHGVFIRAPRITKLGEAVRVLAWLGDEPVCVRQGTVLASSFHPELTDDARLHRYFLSMRG